MKPDWTQDAGGMSNNSAEFHQVVDAVTRLLASHRLCDDVESTARLIVAQLAHKYGLAPR